MCGMGFYLTELKGLSDPGEKYPDTVGEGLRPGAAVMLQAMEAERGTGA